ncbi:MAG: hypothetical protein ABSE15_00955 [Candidatus Bathyarchaeia archaeon]|jgi:hypothetical protein
MASNEQIIQEKLEAARKLTEGKKIEKVEISANHVDLDKSEQRQLVRELIQRKDMQQAFPPEKIQDVMEENEDLKNKLGLISELELEKHRKGVNEKINRYISDPSKRAEMSEKLKSQSPDGIMAMETTMNLLEDQLTKTNNQRFEPAGSPLVPQQMGEQVQGDIYSKKFGNYNDMIQALRNESKSEDKSKAQRASMVLNQLLNKYAQAQKDVHSEQRYCEDDAIPKTDKVPTVDFSQANEQFSELERFGIKKSPLNYSKQRRIIAQKGSES